MMDCALVLAGTIHLPVICVTKTAGRIFSLSAGSSLELVYAAEHAPSPPQQQDALSDDESETTMSREPPQRIFATCSSRPDPLHLRPARPRRLLCVVRLFGLLRWHLDGLRDLNGAVHGRLHFAQAR